MMKNKKYIFWGTGLILCISVALFSSSVNDKKLFEIGKNFEILYAIVKELNLHYVDSIPTEEMFNKGITNMLSTLDPYTTYISAKDSEDFKTMTTGEYGGIGSLIRKQGEYILIAEPYEGKPAHKAGLRAGDKLLAIDGESMKTKSTEYVSSKLKGTPNTNLEIKVERPGENKPLSFMVTRKQIVINPVPHYELVDKQIGYIQLSQFTTHAAEETKKALLDLKKQGASSLILDLRGNSGGSLMEAINIVNFFVPKNTLIVYTKGKVASQSQEYFARNNPIDTEIPLIVLTSAGSASASEIVSGALQDLDRAVVVGNRTFGKGLVQTTKPLPYKGRLKVTTAKYYIPSGRCVQALDYSSRNEDGSVGAIPDSLIKEYTTSRGRIVKDGGGISPDINVEYDNKVGLILFNLFRENFFFDYATNYRLKHSSIAPAKEFTLSEEDYLDFKNFVKENDFHYEPKYTKQLNALIESAKEERSYEKAKDTFDKLGELLQHDLDYDLDMFKEEIISMISSEIITRYYYQRGSAEFALRDDEGVAEAIKVLKDTESYHEILNPEYLHLPI